MASKQKSPKALRLHGTIARDLGVRIVSGRFRPGDILDGEIDASDRLEVSRTAYREAVRILAAKGLVERSYRNITICDVPKLLEFAKVVADNPY